jgi:hypothetical protein
MKNIVGIASTPNREEGLKDTICYLSSQVDHIYVWLNGYKKIPTIEQENVTFYLSKENIGAIGKLKVRDIIKEKDFYFFTCDDDIIYPPNYIEHNLKYFTSGSIQSSHGKIFSSFPITSYKYGDVSGFYFGNKIQEKVKIHIPGTGVALMESKMLKDIPLESFTTRNMIDVWVGSWAHINQIPRYILPHSQNWLIPNHTISQHDSIWEATKNDDSIQIQIINNYFTDYESN